MQPSRRQSFCLSEFKTLLAAIEDGGYQFSSFGQTAAPKPLFLRHDVDKNLHWALDIARLEAEHNVQATYFFLLRSPMYSLLSHESVAILKEINAIGHAIGLHYYARESDDRNALDNAVLRELKLFKDVTGVNTNLVSFHNPPSGVLQRKPDTQAYISVYAPEFMPPATKYISDSNACFREGSPLEALRHGAYPRLQLLLHPVWWAREESKPVCDILVEACEAVLLHLDGYLRQSNLIWDEIRSEYQVTLKLASADGTRAIETACRRPS